MTLRELQLETELGHASRGTIYSALTSRGISAYIEETKLILDEANKKRRMVSQAASGPYLDRISQSLRTASQTENEY